MRNFMQPYLGLRDFNDMGFTCFDEGDPDTGGAGGEGGDDGGGDEPKDLKGLKARLKELTDQRAEFKTQAEAHAQALEDAKAEHATTLKSLEDQVAELNGNTSKHTMERALWKAKVEYDDDMLDLMALKYERAGDEAGTFEEWFAEFSKTSSLFRTEAKPRAEPKADDGDGDGDGDGETKAKAKPDPVGGNKPDAAPAELTTDQIQALSHDEYKKWRQGKKIVVR